MKSIRKRWPLRLLVILVVAIGGLWMLGGRRPDNLGVQNGRLAACPDKPNCVSTQASDTEHQIDPLAFDMDTTEMMAQVRAAIDSMPRTKIVTESEVYLHVEFTSLLLRFVDDLEVWIDREHKLVHARSASRVGHSDLGANRKRMEQLFEQLASGP